MPANIHRSAGGLLACVSLMLPASGQTVYSTDFVDLSGWTTFSSLTGFEWLADATPSVSNCSSPPFHSAPSCLNFNNGVSFGSPTGGSHGTATSPVVALDPSRPAARATFWYSIDHEPACSFDYTLLEVLDAATGEVLLQRCLPQKVAFTDCSWEQARVALDPNWGFIQLRFSAGSIDHLQNSGRGAFIDDLVIEYECGADAELVCPASASVAYPTGQLAYGGARLDADGGPSISAGVLNVLARQIDGPGFALLLAGTGSPGSMSIGNGMLCIPIQTVRRLSLATIDPASSTVGWSIPLGTPNSPLLWVVPGDSLMLQVWYRDVTAGNFSDAVRVRFCH